MLMLVNHKIHSTLQIQVNHYPAGELRVSIPPEGWDTVIWQYESDEELFTLLCISQKFKGLTLVCPYLPHARMDRVKNPEDVFTLKYMCMLINGMGFRAVHVMDVHSDVSAAILENYEPDDRLNVNYYVAEVFQRIASRYNTQKEDMAVLFPDAGAQKRYGSLVAVEGLPASYAVKHRNWETGRIDSLVLTDPEIFKDKPVLIIDDICSYGGTFARAAKALKEAGAKEVFLYVSHCENSIYSGSIAAEGNITKVYTTDSLYRVSQKMDSEDLVENISCLKNFTE